MVARVVGTPLRVEQTNPWALACAEGGHQAEAMHDSIKAAKLIQSLL
jgi:hypothetical protein